MNIPLQNKSLTVTARSLNWCYLLYSSLTGGEMCSIVQMFSIQKLQKLVIMMKDDLSINFMRFWILSKQEHMQASKVLHITAAVGTVREKNGKRHEKASKMSDKEKNMLRLKKVSKLREKYHRK